MQKYHFTKRAGVLVFIVSAVLTLAASAAACGSAAAPTPRRASELAAARSRSFPSKMAKIKRADLLSGVSCSGRDACVAIGAYYYGTAAELTLVERWDGSAWRVQPSPNGPRYSSLQAVSCATSRTCMAVGSPVISWSGHSWRVTRPSSPFNAVSCPAANLCVAVGQTGPGVPMFGEWNGQAWYTGTLPTVPQHRTSVTVSGVSCAPSPAAICLAVGNYSYGAKAMPAGSYRDRILAESFTAAGWRLLPTVNVGTVDQLDAVSCSSAGSCTAVGASAQQYPLAEHWNGTAWQVQHVPLPGRIGYTQLSAVSCVSASACMAVGDYQGLPIAESWNGSTWLLHWLPRPPGDNNSATLDGVSCTGAPTCLAVGVSGNGLSYAERWNGTTWLLQATANPS